MARYISKPMTAILATAVLGLTTPASAGDDDPGWGNISGGGSFSAWSGYDGASAGEAQGWGDDVETVVKLEDQVAFESIGNLKADPGCKVKCGDTTVQSKWQTLQLGMAGVLATSQGHGDQSSVARTKLGADLGVQGGFEFDIPKMDGVAGM